LDAFLGTVSEPEAWQNFPPEYPEAARRRGWSGTVTLRVRIGADGQVLDAAAVVAIRTWRYRPARLGQEPIEYTLRQPVQFELTGRSR
jgi:protein TonB